MWGTTWEDLRSSLKIIFLSFFRLAVRIKIIFIASLICTQYFTPKLITDRNISLNISPDSLALVLTNVAIIMFIIF